MRSRRRGEGGRRRRRLARCDLSCRTGFQFENLDLVAQLQRGRFLVVAGFENLQAACTELEYPFENLVTIEAMQRSMDKELKQRIAAKAAS